MDQSLEQLLFLVYYRPATDLSVFIYKLIGTQLVIFFRDAADQYHFSFGIGPRVFSGDNLIIHII